MMGAFLLLVIALVVIALLELQFHFTLGQILQHLIMLLTGQP